jgi:hypothetical protein
MVTIPIWPTAFAAIEAALPNGSEAEARSDGKGGGHVAALDRLKAMCGPGESYSNVIPRLANETPSQ